MVSFLQIAQILITDGLLSVDNAAVIAAMAEELPDIDPPRGVPKWLGRQRQAALKVGFLGALVFRLLMIAGVAIIIKHSWIKILGGIYLLYLALQHFVPSLPHLFGFLNKLLGNKGSGQFWATVVNIELADVIFSLDNAIAIVAITQNMATISIGLLGAIIMMRFAATGFEKLMEWEPKLESGAFLLIALIALELLANEILHVEVGDALKFVLSMLVLVATVVVARVGKRFKVIV